MSTPYPNGIYNGRMQADGEGNLLASEGEYAGYPIAYHDGSYVYVQPGEPSHNARHHQQFASSTTINGEVTTGITGTVDASMTDDTDLINTDDTINPHHFATLEDDPHYEEGYMKDNGVISNTRPKNNPDTIAPRITGHTDSQSAGGTP
jgi:hypothetical protein